MQALGKAFLALPDRIRIAILLYCSDGLSVPEIADILEVSEDTVLGCLCRGMELLGKKIGISENDAGRLEKETVGEAISILIETFPVPELLMKKLEVNLAASCGYELETNEK